ncbi:MAG: ABC transporter ATP-binding protein [Alphaproteobacteria bacterium]|nr:ABC transporter ATP-binding protein [Alphaproteobacteria bacterium]
MNPGAAAPLVRVDRLSKHFTSGSAFTSRRILRAVDDVSFEIAAGETLGLVGESGSGKSTLGRMIIGLTAPSAGNVIVADQPVAGARRSAALWRTTQMVFQDPYASLNPKMTVAMALREPLRNFAIATGAAAERRVREVLDACGLPQSAASRYPREFSGGQRQRIGIARALIVDPLFIVADEPVSALDVSIQAQIINLLLDLKRDRGLTYLFIAHDLAVVRQVSDCIAVMYAGRVVEIGPARDIYRQPAHPYTQLLLRSVPIPDPAMERARRDARAVVPARPEVSADAGCAFAARCPTAQFPRCGAERPPLAQFPDGRMAACHFPEIVTPSPALLREAAMS